MSAMSDPNANQEHIRDPRVPIGKHVRVEIGGLHHDAWICGDNIQQLALEIQLDIECPSNLVIRDGHHGHPLTVCATVVREIGKGVWFNYYVLEPDALSRLDKVEWKLIIGRLDAA